MINTKLVTNKLTGGLRRPPVSSHDVRRRYDLLHRTRQYVPLGRVAVRALQTEQLADPDVATMTRGGRSKIPLADVHAILGFDATVMGIIQHGSEVFWLIDGKQSRDVRPVKARTGSTWYEARVGDKAIRLGSEGLAVVQPRVYLDTTTRTGLSPMYYDDKVGGLGVLQVSPHDTQSKRVLDLGRGFGDGGFNIQVTTFDASEVAVTDIGGSGTEVVNRAQISDIVHAIGAMVTI